MSGALDYKGLEDIQQPFHGFDIISDHFGIQQQVSPVVVPVERLGCAGHFQQTKLAVSLAGVDNDAFEPRQAAWQ